MVIAIASFYVCMHTRGSPEQDTATLWISEAFLRCWVPELSDVPPESPQEEIFLRWLGVEQRLAQPELVIQRLKSHATFIHRFLDDLPEHPEAGSRQRAL